LPWLLNMPDLRNHEHGLALDAFAGSGVVSYGLSQMGWTVHACDRLASSGSAVKAFCGGGPTLTSTEIDSFSRLSRSTSRGWLVEAYQGIHFPDDELHWLDNASELAAGLDDSQRHIALWALCQSALAKRPYNLFHRSNLAMRTRDVSRSFGNKVTWEKPFFEHFRKFVEECEKLRLSTGFAEFHRVDPRELELAPFDLVYIDPPYVNARGTVTPYNDYYSFLDFICDPGSRAEIDLTKAHRPRTWARSHWESPQQLIIALDDLIENHPAATVVLSYRSDGVPTLDELANLLARHRRHVNTFEFPIKYALSTATASREAVIVGRDGQR
jgi:adenine-specific DNA-methyltransferase